MMFPLKPPNLAQGFPATIKTLPEGLNHSQTIFKPEIDWFNPSLRLGSLHVITVGPGWLDITSMWLRLSKLLFLLLLLLLLRAKHTLLNNINKRLKTQSLSLPCLRWKLSLTRFNCQTNVCRKTWFPYFGGCAHFALFRCTQSNPWLSGNGLRLATCSWSGFPRSALVPHWSRMTPISDRLCPWFLQQPGWLLRLGTSGPCVGHLKKPLKRCSVRVEDTSWMSRKQARIVWSMFATQQTIGILIGICSLCPASTWRLLAAHLARLKHLRLCSHMAWRHGAHSLGRCRLKKTSPPEL